jgi:glucose-6-phosphate 1-dehydrogenase
MRISPDILIALETNVLGPDEATTAQPAEMVACHQPTAGELSAYERVLGDAMEGDATLFARQDYVEEAWRIVDPILDPSLPLHEYAPHTWGPAEADTIAPAGGWVNPG